MAKTTREWWNTLKNDPARIERWLRDQYRGERTAVDRLEDFLERFPPGDSRALRTVRVIMGQESDHASWIQGLLETRGITVTPPEKAERYWPPVIDSVSTFARAAAASAHAEKMRLERIQVIADDPEAPADIRAVFQRILPQEVFHERAFREIAGDEAMAAMLPAHQRGMEALGFIPSDF